MFLASKFGYRTTSEGMIIDTSPQYAYEAIDKSLTRLGVSCIDLYYVHRLDQATPIEKTMRALVELKREGKLRHIGLS